MSYEIYFLTTFEKQVKRLSKKHASFKSDLINLIETLRENPKYGQDLGGNFYKIRLAISSKGKVKSGGARIITYVKVVDKIVYLTAIYDKSEKDSVSKKELNSIFNSLP